MIPRLLELASLTSFAAIAVVGDILSPTPQWVTQYGALALVAFMVMQNYRQSRETHKALREKDFQIQQGTFRANKLTEESIIAMNRLANCFEDRPCIAGAQPIKTSSKED